MLPGSMIPASNRKWSALTWAVAAGSANGLMPAPQTTLRNSSGSAFRIGRARLAARCQAALPPIRPPCLLLQIGPLHERDAPIIPVKQLYFVWGGSTFARSSRRTKLPKMGQGWGTVKCV